MGTIFKNKEKIAFYCIYKFGFYSLERHTLLKTKALFATSAAANILQPKMLYNVNLQRQFYYWSTLPTY